MKKLFLIPLLLSLVLNLNAVIKVAFCTFQRTMDATATTVDNDPIIQMLKSDPNLSVTVKVLTAVAATDLITDLANYDVIVVQSSLAGSAGIFTPTGSLALKSIPKPCLYNQSWTFKQGRALTSSSANGQIANSTLSIKVDISAISNELFNGCSYGSNYEIKLFNALSTDAGLISGGTKAVDYSSGNSISRSTLLATPTAFNYPVAISVNDIPAGTTIDSETTNSRIITLGMNFGAICANNGNNITSDNLKIWRNAIYILAGFPSPEIHIPAIYTSTTSLSNFNYNKGSGPSAEQSFSINGVALGSNITITPSANIQISKTSGSGFVNTPITLTQTSGVVSATNIYVRLKAGLNFANYLDSLLITSTNATSKKIICSGTVTGPIISTSITSLSNLNYNKGSGPSAEQLFSINGTILESDITITPSANLQISKTSGSGFVNTPITLTQTSGVVSATNIYVRLKAGLNFANYLDSLIITSTNAITKKVICNGTVVGPTLTNSVSSLSGFSYANGTGPSSAKSFTISASLLEGSLFITPTTNYEISRNGSTYYSTPIELTPTTGTVNSTTIYVRLKAGISAGSYNENISLSSLGAVTKNIACSGTVLGPKITISTSSISGLFYIYDNGPSDQQSFLVSGSDLTSNIVITPNSNFQISTVSGGSFTTSAITLTQTSGIVNSTAVYVRLKAGLAISNYNGSLIMTSTNADSQTITCSGTVTDILDVSSEVNKSKLKVFTTITDIVIEGTNVGETISIFSPNGKQIKTLKSEGERIVVPVQKDAVYLIKIENKVFKIIM